MKVSGPAILALCLSIASMTAVTAAPPAKKEPSKPAAAPKQTKPGQAAPSGANSAELNNYANQIRQKMAGSWNYPPGNNKVTLKVEVATDGSVSNMNLDSNPKNSEAEQKANDAFNAAQPLPALPSGVSGARITCQFDSNADQWGGKANVAVKIDPLKSAAAPSSDSNNGSTDNKGEKK